MLYRQMTTITCSIHSIIRIWPSTSIPLIYLDWLPIYDVSNIVCCGRCLGISTMFTRKGSGEFFASLHHVFDTASPRSNQEREPPMHSV